MIGSTLNTTFPDNLQITSNYNDNDNSTTLILIVTVVVVLCVTIVVITIILLIRRYTENRNRKTHLNEVVAELEHRNLTDKVLNPSKSIQF